MWIDLGIYRYLKGTIAWRSLAAFTSMQHSKLGGESHTSHESRRSAEIPDRGYGQHPPGSPEWTGVDHTGPHVVLCLMCCCAWTMNGY